MEPKENSQSMSNQNDGEEEYDDDMIEVIYDDDIYDDDDDDDEGEEGNYGTDQGDLADIEDEGDDGDTEAGPGLEGFTGQKPSMILSGHQESAVFCCSFDSTCERLLTGGEDDICNVWDSSSIETRFPVCKCRGHKDSVISASFSFDSTYFSSADLSGVVKVWRTSTFKNILSLETGDLTWSFWHFGSNVLFAGCEDGSIYMWKVPSGECKILNASGSKCECATLLLDGKRIVAGYEDGGIKQFDLKTGQVQHTLYNPTPRSCAVLCIDRSQNLNVVAAGNFKGKVNIYNTQTGKHLTTLQCSPMLVGRGGGSAAGDEDGNADSVESVAFCPDTNLNYLAGGSVAGHIALWDVTSMTERMRLKQDAGLTKLVWDPKSPVVYTGGLDGVVRGIDARTCQVERILGRHRSEVLDLSVAKDGTKLVSCSEDGSTFIFNLEQA